MTTTKTKTETAVTYTDCRSRGCSFAGRSDRDGWCRNHAAMVKATGITTWAGNPPHRSRTMTTRQRFDSYVTVSAGGCWLWIGGIARNGYAILSDPERGIHSMNAHRWSYEEFNGPIPEGLDVDHLCRVRSCVNPRHLEAVTHSVNMRRAFAARRARRAADRAARSGVLFDLLDADLAAAA